MTEQLSTGVDEQEVSPMGDSEDVSPTGDTEDTSGAANAAPDPDGSPDDEQETFPREYVEKLRKESAGHRDRAKRADELAARLHTALVVADGRLADPNDLLFSSEHLDDADALTAAVDDLLGRKPHLASRKPRGDVGQGAAGGDATVDLAGLLRSRAG